MKVVILKKSLNVVNLGSQLKVNAINPYTATTNNYVSNTKFNLYTGTTAPNTFANKTVFNTYTGTTNTAINSRLLTSVFYTYSGVTNTAISARLLTSAFNTYSGATLTNINSRLLTSSFNTYSGATLTNINTRLVSTKFNTYTGTTAPAQFASKTVFNTYTGTTNTALNARLLTTSFNTYSGATGARLSTVENNYVSGYTSLGNVSLLGSKLGRNLRFKGLIAGTNITLTPTASGITINSTGGGGGGSTANNGLRIAGSNVVLGGGLTGSTTIGLGTNNLTFTGTTGTLRYGSDLSANYNVRSLPDVGYVSGNTIGKSGVQYYFTRDTSLNTAAFNNVGLNSSVNSIAFQSDGKIVAGGDFTSLSGTSNNNYLVRFNISGTKDSSFNISTGFNNVVTDVIVQPDGKILVGGFFSTYSGVTANAIIRLLSNGQRDNSFVVGTAFSAAGGSQNVNDMILESNGKITIVGNFTGWTGTSQNFTIRLLSNGQRDNSYAVGTAFNQRATCIAIDSNSKLYIGGQFTTWTGTSQNRIIRLLSTGQRDNTFAVGTGFDAQPNKIVIQQDGKILVGGSFTTYNSVVCNGLVRINTNGSIDNTFTTQNTAINVSAINVLSTSKILVGGLFTNYLGKPVNRFVQLNANGTLDTSYDYNALTSNFYIPTATANYPLNIVTDSSSRIYLTGQFTRFNNQAASNIVRLTTTNPINVTLPLEYVVDNSTSYSPRSVVDYGYITGNTVLTNGSNYLRATAVEVFEDFHGLLTTMPILVSNVSGTGAVNSNSTVLDDEGHPGILESGVGTTAAGRAGVQQNNNSNMMVIPNSPSTRVIYESVFKIPVLSDATNTFIVQAGLSDNISAEATDGIYLRYTHGFNTGKFAFITRSNTAQSVLSGGTTVVANTWYKFRFELSFTDGVPRCEFFINGISEGVLTSNVPTGAGRNTSITQNIRKTVGLVNRTLQTDYILYRMIFNR